MSRPDDADCTACDELEKFLFQYADGELDQDQAHHLREHVAHCPHCKNLVDAEMHVRELIRRCYFEHAPSSLRTRVISRIRMTHLRIETEE